MRARSSRLRSTNSHPSDDRYGAVGFRIAHTFTDSLVRLTGDEQKAVKTTAFDLQLNSANPGMSFHKLAKAKDKRFWGVGDVACAGQSRRFPVGDLSADRWVGNPTGEEASHFLAGTEPTKGGQVLRPVR